MTVIQSPELPREIYRSLVHELTLSVVLVRFYHLTGSMNISFAVWEPIPVCKNVLSCETSSFDIALYLVSWSVRHHPPRSSCES